jgi:hypothetical protein
MARFALCIAMVSLVGFLADSSAASNTKYARNQRIIDLVTKTYPRDATPEEFLREMQPFMTRQTFSLYSEFFKELKKMGIKRIPNLVPRGNNEFMIQYNRHTLGFAFDPKDLNLITINGRKLDFTAIDDPHQQFEMILRALPKQFSIWNLFPQILVPPSNANAVRLLEAAGRYLTGGPLTPTKAAIAAGGAVVTTTALGVSDHCESYTANLSFCRGTRDKLKDMGIISKRQSLLSEAGCKTFTTIDNQTVDLPGADLSGITCGCNVPGNKLAKIFDENVFFTPEQRTQIRQSETQARAIIDTVLAQHEKLEKAGCAITEAGNNTDPDKLNVCLAGLQADMARLCMISLSRLSESGSILDLPPPPNAPSSSGAPK